ncbi:MAG: putative DNA binding domain-containing protein [Candidatus Latescibacteria bacterium]|nr:putative DNA binding domain-containing protein [Candidatus Latescibacterota bacterium]
MNRTIFTELIKQGETDRVEFKEARSNLPQDIWKTISAFANTNTGWIVLGISQEKGMFSRKGVENPHQIMDDLTSTIGQRFNFCPVIRPEIVRQKGKDFMTVKVEEAPRYQKPIYIKDAGPIKGGYKRVGATDIRLTDADLQRFFQERMGSPDAQPVKGTSITDADELAFVTFRNLRRLEKPDAPELSLSNEGILKAYNLLAQDEKTLTAAGLLLFGKETAIRRVFPAWRLDVIRIKGTEWGKDKDPFLSQDSRGSLLTIRIQVLDIINRFFMIPFKMGKGLARTEENPFNRAMREALSNLLMHQNYFHPSPAQLRVYNDRIEFYNPGYSLKDPDSFNVPGSELRNPLISSVFYDIGWAETKGTGFKTVIMEIVKSDYPVPRWESSQKKDTFTLVLPYQADQVTPQVTPQVTVTDRHATVLRYCEQPRLLKEIMEFLGLSDRKNFMEQILNPLLNAGHLERTIPDKPRSRFQKYVTVRAKGKE